MDSKLRVFTKMPLPDWVDLSEFLTGYPSLISSEFLVPSLHNLYILMAPRPSTLLRIVSTIPILASYTSLLHYMSTLYNSFCLCVIKFGKLIDLWLFGHFRDYGKLEWQFGHLLVPFTKHESLITWLLILSVYILSPRYRPFSNQKFLVFLVSQSF